MSTWTAQHTWLAVGAAVVALLLQTVLLIDVSNSMGRVGAQVTALDTAIARANAMAWSVHAPSVVPPSSSSPSSSSSPTTPACPTPSAAVPRVVRRARFLTTIICSPTEFERRTVMRETVLRGVRKQVPVQTKDAATGAVVREEVMVAYRFVIGDLTPTQADPNPRHNFKAFEAADQAILAQLAEEERTYGDLLRLPLPEGHDRLTLKRMHAIVWAHTQQTLVDEYDFLLMMDTDTYVRFDALYTHMREGLGRPAIDAVRTSLYGYMGYLHQFPDPAAAKDPDITTHTWYMVGQAITFTPPLVARLVARRYELWLGFPYPLDDVALGHWVSIVVAANPALGWAAVELLTVRNNAFQLDTNSDYVGQEPRWDTFHHINVDNMKRLAQRLGDEPVGTVAQHYD